jgi:hypothetical protein
MAMTIKFKHGKAYVVTRTNKAYEFSTVDLAKKYASDDDVVLVALPKTVSKEAVEKIVLDFDKKLLTIVDGSVTLNKVTYEAGEHEMDDLELEDFSQIISDIITKCDKYEIKGNPKVEGDIIK